MEAVYIQNIIELLMQCDDLSLLELIYSLLTQEA